MKTIAVIGAGASGMTAALTAAENPDNQITLFERQARPGKKLLSTGNGRCNLTNRHCSPAHYHGEAMGFADYALAEFGWEETLAWFAGLGLMTVEEDSGRIYPLSDHAASVLDCLRLGVENRGIRLLTGCDVRAVEGSRGQWYVSTAEATERFDAVILCCGGAAGARVGGTGEGYALAEALGHRRTKLFPAVCRLRTENNGTLPLKGIRTQAVIRLVKDKTVLAESRGEIQFTDNGVSGPAAFELSRDAARAPKGTVVRLDLLPDTDRPSVIQYLKEKRAAFPDSVAGQLLTGTVHNTIGRTVVRLCAIAQDESLAALSDRELAAVAGRLKQYDLALTGTAGFEDAQVTAGGINCRDVDPQTMQSRICPGLYFCGELLDVDGDCGGYNLQWAWSSGHLAGLAAGGML